MSVCKGCSTKGSGGVSPGERRRRRGEVRGGEGATTSTIKPAHTEEGRGAPRPRNGARHQARAHAHAHAKDQARARARRRRHHRRTCGRQTAAAARMGRVASASASASARGRRVWVEPEAERGGTGRGEGVGVQRSRRAARQGEGPRVLYKGLWRWSSPSRPCKGRDRRTEGSGGAQSLERGRAH